MWRPEVNLEANAFGDRLTDAGASGKLPAHHVCCS